MDNTKQTKSKELRPLKHTADKSFKNNYLSVEAASLAKMESAKDFIANIDLTVIKANGHIE